MAKRNNTKAHVACYVLKTCGPLTRIDLMMRVHVLEGKREAFKPTSNISYFSPKLTPENITKRCGMYYGEDHYMKRNAGSWLQKDIIKIVGKTKEGAYLYDITSIGHELAGSYMK
jgi:hypothetical protein